MTPLRRLLLSLAVVALAQTAVLAGMVADRTQLLRAGREIVLPVVPVDPRDLFRGEYVRLGYDIGRVPTRLLDGPAPARNAAFYVVLERKADGAWSPVKVSAAMPAETSPERIVLKGRTMHGGPFDDGGGTAWVRYGIESYFVPEGRGLELEKLARDRRISTLVAVDSGGNAAIKGLLIDGQLQYEKPLF